MKNKFLIFLILLFSFSTQANADESFDAKFNEAQKKISDMKASLNQDNSFSSVGSDIQGAKITGYSDNTLNFDLSIPKATLPKLPKLSSNSNLNSFASPCSAAYLLSLGGKNVQASGCEPCVIAGQSSTNKLLGVLDPTVISTAIDPSDDIVTPAEWNNLSEYQKKIILDQNPQIELAKAKSEKEKNLLQNCMTKTEESNNKQNEALNFFKK